MKGVYAERAYEGEPCHHVAAYEAKLWTATRWKAGRIAKERKHLYASQ